MPEPLLEGAGRGERHAVRKLRQSRRRQGPARAPAKTLPIVLGLSLRRARAQNEKPKRGAAGLPQGALGVR
jgi:hypothetical protein